MGLNGIMTIISVLLLGAVFGYHWRLTRRVARMIGSEVPDTGGLDGGAGAERRVYYFFSRKCRVCRGIAAMVDEVAAGHANLIRVDVAEHLDLTDRFGIMGTPTFVAVADGHIRDIKLGAPSKVWLQSYLEH